MNVASELIAFTVGAVSFFLASLFATKGQVSRAHGPNSPIRLPVAWWVWVLLVTLVTAQIYGSREVYGDTEVYYQNLQMIQELGYSPIRAWFFNIMSSFMLRFTSVETTLILITMFVCFGVSLGIARYVKDYAGSLAASAVMFTSFYCLGIQSNVLTQGLAIALLLSFLPELLLAEKNLPSVAKAALICFLASGFHMSVFLIFVPCLLAAHIIRFKIQIAIGIAVAATVISLFGGGIERLPFLGDALASSGSFYVGYLDNIKDERYYRIGFRADFTVFVWFYALWGIYAWAKLGVRDRRYEQILSVYLLCQSVFVCSFNIPFADRIGLYCFVLIPILVCYPFGRVKALSSTDAWLLLHVYILCNLVFTFFYFGRYWF